MVTASGMGNIPVPAVPVLVIGTPPMIAGDCGRGEGGVGKLRLVFRIGPPALRI